MSTAKLLLHTFNETRSLTSFYFNKIKDANINLNLDVNGIQLNSPKWIMAHLTWAEHFLLLEALGSEKMEIDWFSKVSFGSSMCNDDDLPDIENIIDTMNKIHEATQVFAGAITDEMLEEKNSLGLKFGPNENKKYMLIHAIRHEGIHAGHLGWLCKINGIKSF